MDTTYISDYIWRRIAPEVRRAVLNVLPRNEVVGQYVATIVSDLHLRGEYEVANDLLAEIKYLKNYKKEWGVLPPPETNSHLNQ
mgnify:CR=1 FL=1